MLLKMFSNLLFSIFENDQHARKFHYNDEVSEDKGPNFSMVQVHRYLYLNHFLQIYTNFGVDENGNSS